MPSPSDISEPAADWRAHDPLLGPKTLIGDITTQDIVRWLESKGQVSKRTWNGYRNDAQTFFEWFARPRQWIAENPVKPVPQHKLARSLPERRCRPHGRLSVFAVRASLRPKITGTLSASVVEPPTIFRRAVAGFSSVSPRRRKIETKEGYP